MIDTATRRRILIDALNGQIERYRAHARDLRMIHAQKPGHGFDDQAQGLCALASAAEAIRDEIKEA